MARPRDGHISNKVQHETASNIKCNDPDKHRSYLAGIVPALGVQCQSPPVEGGPSDGHGTQARAVTDADEEIFLLYTLAAAEPDRRGLGQVDARNDALQFDIDWSDVVVSKGVATTSISLGSARDNLVDSPPQSGRGASKKQSVREKQARAAGKGRPSARSTALRAVIRQDSTSLQSTGGDTGSVVWRSSVSLATKLITDIVRASQTIRHDPGAANTSLLHPDALVDCRILELGAGTGILPCLLLACPVLHISERFHWLATDQEAMLGLLQKNIRASCQNEGVSGTSVAALDWNEASHVYRKGTASAMDAYQKQLFSQMSGNGDASRGTSLRPDIILATDCIFNPSLYSAFVDTLNLLTRAVTDEEDGQCDSLGTATIHASPILVLVVCELREADALRDFVEQWLAEGHRGEQWRINTIEDAAVLGPSLARGSVVWVAWREK